MEPFTGLGLELQLDRDCMAGRGEGECCLEEELEEEEVPGEGNGCL